MSLDSTILILIASFLAGAMNAIAGGGTFFSFPALLAIGVPPVMANATNSVALWPASLSSAWAYRNELSRHKKRLLLLTLVAFVGGILGSMLLLSIRDEAFARLIPWLLLFATVVFAFSDKISSLANLHTLSRDKIFHLLTLPALLGVSVYGGFFGAGLGILLIAYLLIVETQSISEANALKNYLSAVTYSVSVVVFVSAGAISWQHMLMMLPSATLGGYMGALFAKKISHRLLRWIITIVGFGLSWYYF